MAADNNNAHAVSRPRTENVFSTCTKAFFQRIPGGRRASLKFVDMSNLNLAGRCLAEADLSGAKFRFADLRAADLRDANMCRR